MWPWGNQEKDTKHKIFTALPQSLLIRVFEKLVPSDWLRLGRVNKVLRDLTISDTLWKPEYQKRFYYHYHKFGPEAQKWNWIKIYRQCDFTERSGSQMVGHMKTIEDKAFFSPMKKKAFRCDWSPSSITITILGSPGCGKTSFISRLKGKPYNDTYVSTMGAQNIKYLAPFHGKVIELNFWDCSGQERYTALNTKLLNFCDIAFLFYDCSSSESFQVLKTWWVDISKLKATFSVCLVGAKSDTEMASREIQLSDVKAFAKQEGISFIGEVSAKTGENFNGLIENIYQLYRDLKKDSTSEV